MIDVFLFPIGVAVVLGTYIFLQERSCKKASPSSQRSNVEHVASVNIIRLTTTSNDRPPIGNLFSDLDSMLEEES